MLQINSNQTRQKRIVAIHDISCVGKCSLTAALPIISAAGIETAVIPTAVLSTHTGGFKGYTFRDLTDDILPIVEHWQSEGLDFDAVYTGYLGSFRQIDIVEQVIGIYKKQGALIMVDPAMADNGVLYSSFDASFPKGMMKLCTQADVIVPNITEACMMLEREYQQPPYKKEYIEELLKQLGEKCGRYVVLTGVCFDDLQLGAATYDKVTSSIHYCMTKRIEGMYHGTGDVFASALLAAMLSGKAINCAAQIAVEFTAESIRQTLKIKQSRYYGVNFEAALPFLIENIQL